MSKPEPDDKSWLMITPVVADSIKYLVHVTDYLLKDNYRLSTSFSILYAEFAALKKQTTDNLLTVNKSIDYANELSLSNASKIYHIYTICSHSEERMTKYEYRIDCKLYEISNGLYETLASRTADLMKMIDIKYQYFASEIVKNTTMINKYGKVFDDRLYSLNANYVNLVEESTQLYKINEDRWNEIKGQMYYDNSEIAYQFGQHNSKIQQLRSELLSALYEYKEIYEKYETDQIHMYSHEYRVELHFKAIDEQLYLYQKLQQYLEAVNVKVDKLNHTQIKDRQKLEERFGEKDYLLETIEQQLSQKINKTVNEIELLKEFKNYNEAYSSQSPDYANIEDMKARIMQKVIENGLLTENIIDSVILQYPYNEEQSIENDKLSAKSKLQYIEQLIGLSDTEKRSVYTKNQHESIHKSMHESYDFVSQSYVQLRYQLETPYYYHEIISSYYKIKVMQPLQPILVENDHESNNNSADIFQMSSNNLIPSPVAISNPAYQQYDYQYNSISNSNMVQSQDLSMVYSSPALKNLQLYLEEAKNNIEKIRKQQENYTSQIIEHLQPKINYFIQYQLKQSGLADFLSLDQYPAVSGSFRRSCSGQLEPYSQKYQEWSDGGANGVREKQIFNSPTGMQALRDFPKVDPNFSRSNGYYVLSRNFYNSQIYKELYLELYKQINVENEIQYYKYMKEITRVDKLVDIYSQELINCEERLKKLIKNSNSSFRRSTSSSLVSSSKGCYINVSKPVLMIGYTGDSKGSERYKK